ncbi:hypothetical protein SDC9_128411 [bioreactor metagenome]|uniref:Uncharacterized protein n=1 Tax=bioreactor metagenome TaxID=1076179 RepID=A0A645CWX9_9ZZZZ
MFKVHHGRLALPVFLIMVTKLGVLVALRVGILVFAPEVMQGKPCFLQLLADVGEKLLQPGEFIPALRVVLQQDMLQCLVAVGGNCPRW